MSVPAEAPPSDHRRERLLAFVRFVWRRFLDDKCFEAAGALSYTTVFALVPLTTAALGIIAAFPVFEEWSAKITDFIFANFVPAAGRVVQGYLTEFAANAKKLTSAGVIALIVSSLLLMSSIEEQFNRIWRVPPRRRRVVRFIVYWTVLSLGPILLAASLGATSYLLSLAMRDGVADPALYWNLVPAAVTFVSITLAFMVVPNANVRWRHAMPGALLATALFELAKSVFAGYLSRASYEQVYGALSVIPIFLIWVYLSWSVVLLGASLSASLTAFRFQPKALRVPPGLEFPILLRMLRRIAAAAAKGEPLDRAALMGKEPGLTDEQMDRFLNLLRTLQLAQRSENGAWLMLRQPESLSLAELFDAGAFRFPDETEMARLRARAEPEDAALLEWIAGARAAAQAALAVPASRIVTVAPSPPVVAGEPS